MCDVIKGGGDYPKAEFPSLKIPPSDGSGIDFHKYIGKKLGIVIPGLEPFVIQCTGINEMWLEANDAILFNINHIVRIEVIDEKRIIAPKGT